MASSKILFKLFKYTMILLVLLSFTLWLFTYKKNRELSNVNDRYLTLTSEIEEYQNIAMLLASAKEEKANRLDNITILKNKVETLNKEIDDYKNGIIKLNKELDIK